MARDAEVSRERSRLHASKQLNETMARCCVKDCEQDSVIRQPLVFGDKLTMHVPLCAVHNDIWERFVEYMNKSRKQRAKDQKLAAWAMDAAMAYGAFPGHEER